jgi:hypothetical protein
VGYMGRFFALLPLAGALLAADPFLGTWKLNSAKSIYSKGTPPNEEVLIIGSVGRDLDVAVKGTAADGTVFFSRYTGQLSV